ncbi:MULTISPECIES: hypothetical protein [unclassified Sphingomonas]|nr:MULTISPECIES: hypothetical protein [unclassified Sphingomonas]MCH4894229.1 hypothetical protein [Sphingomonas sp. SFZ2018-12]
MLWIQALPALPARQTPPAPRLTETPGDCAAAPGDDIVICRRRDDARYRLAPLPDTWVRSDRAEADLAGGKLSVEAEQGRYDPRLMLRFKLPF